MVTEGRLLWLPHSVFQIYLLSTSLLFAFGPLNLPVDNAAIMVVFLICTHVAIYVGFKSGIQKTKPKFPIYRFPLWFLAISIFCTLVLLYPTIASRSNGMSLAESVSDSGRAYSQKLVAIRERLRGGETSILSIVRAFLGPLLACCIPCGICFWPRLSLFLKGLWCVSMFGIAIEALVGGSGKVLSEIVLACPLFFIIAYNRGVFGRALLVTKKLMLVVLVFALTVAGAFWFASTRMSRYGGRYAAGSIGWSQRYGIELPPEIESPLYFFVSYFAQGYYGLAGSLDLPFSWTFGFGHSSFASRMVDKFVASDLRLDLATYPARLSQVSRWSVETQWHTVYPWLASDLTFPGAILFVGCMSYLLAVTWRESLEDGLLLSTAFLWQLVLFFIYIPLNNGRLSFSEELFAFWGTLILWKLERNRIPLLGFGSNN